MDTFKEIAEIIHEARKKAYASVNFAMVEAYWRIGERIVKDEQKGNERSEYGSGLLKDVSNRLVAEFGKGYNERNLRNMRAFFLQL